MIEFRGRGISRGYARGRALVSRMPISFYGGVDPDSGVVIERGHDLEGESVANRILIFPWGKGSTVGSYVIYKLVKSGLGPKAIVNIEAEPVIAIGAIISGIPMVDKIGKHVFKVVTNNDIIEVYGDTGIIRCLTK